MAQSPDIIEIVADEDARRSLNSRRSVPVTTVTRCQEEKRKGTVERRPQGQELADPAPALLVLTLCNEEGVDADRRVVDEDAAVDLPRRRRAAHGRPR